jgi:hypothetical protein
VAKPKPLSAQQRRFVDEYLVDFSGQHAAGRAGYATSNTGVGVRLLRDARISQEITQRCLKIQARLEMNGDDIRRGFARIATDPREPVDGGPSFDARIKALRELGLLLGLYTSKIELRGSITLVDLLAAADERTLEHLDRGVPIPSAKETVQ